MIRWLMEVTDNLLRKKLRNLSCRGDHSSESRYTCDVCEPIYGLLFPQGWSHYPGDVCEHGMYTGGCGVDWMCGPCEGGDDTKPPFGYVIRALWSAIRAQGGAE